MKKLCFDVAIETGKWFHFEPSTVIDELQADLDAWSA